MAGRRSAAKKAPSIVSRPILNMDELEYFPFEHGERFQARIGQIGRRIGAKQLGYNLTVLPPGKRAFQFHSHRANEEMFFVVEGEGEVRIGADRFPIRRGDVIACPAGGRETAHQIVNTSATDELKYLAVSTQMSPEVCEYPDTDKYGVVDEYIDAKGQHRTRYLMVKSEASLEDYWEGEK